MADGLINLSYGPRDIVLIDGNYLHGVTSLRAPSACGNQKGRQELERFSLINFSSFARKRRIHKHGNYVPVWEAGMSSQVMLR